MYALQESSFETQTPTHWKPIGRSVIAQQYSSVIFASVRFYSRGENIGAHSKK
jgi:hypothetical protein